MRNHLETLGLESFALLTGGKGIHVVVPVVPRGEWSEVRDFAKAFCTVLAHAHPDRFTLETRKDRRHGRIFLDYLRNQRTATAIMPYSARARLGAPIAAPVEWDELESIESPQHFTIEDSPQLIKRARRLRHWGMADQSLPKLK